MITLRILIVVAVSLLLFPLKITLASENLDLPVTKINPGNFYYSFKRIWEKSYEYLNFSTNSKINYRDSLLRTRLAELSYIAGNKILSEFESSSNRFSYQAGVLTQLIEKQNDEERKKKTLEDFQNYAKFLVGLRDKYPANSSFWLLIQHNINTLNILADSLK